MYSKFFTRLFLLIGMIGQFSVPLRADEIQIGSGNSTDYNLPTHSNYDYSLTQQIYTAEEIETAGGGDGTINSISFYKHYDRGASRFKEAFFIASSKALGISVVYSPHQHRTDFNLNELSEMLCVHNGYFTCIFLVYFMVL